MRDDRRRGAVAIALWLACGCAQVQSGRDDSPDLSIGGQPGDGDMLGAAGDDLSVPGATVDLALPPGTDLAGLDLAHAVTPGGDMAMLCDAVKQTGCGANEKCTYDGTKNSCESVTGTAKATGAGCGPGVDDCVGGDVCVSDQMGGTELCMQYCNVDADCKQATVANGVAAHRNNSLIGTSLKLCTTSCAPFNAADGMGGCPAGLACDYGIGSGNVEIGDCTEYGTGGDGAACNHTMANTCKPGYSCITVNMVDTCRQVCRVAANGTPMSGDCTGGTGYQCITFTGVVSPKFGICLHP